MPGGSGAAVRGEGAQRGAAGRDFVHGRRAEDGGRGAEGGGDRG